MASTLEGDFNYKGNVSFRSITLPDGCIEDEDIEAEAGIDADKLEHQHRIGYAQPNTAAADETRVILVATGATGEVVNFKAGSIAIAVGDATCTVDLKKNGTTVLTAPITLTSGNTNRVPVAATISVDDFAEDDVFEVVIDGTIGTGTLPTGVFCSLTVREDAQ